ncbi:tetratricopeptide repeat-containing sensor histidine kinase [Marinilabilia rubra]|uniref:histidine kinase n=1 Tax=Marinilabilia rubra TaxID=2162893 RepID=A0A2U2B5U6_9BACT|nr:ATP-binding protein [Marinilabilia rubra]PWD98449.1 hypothetical protein DDZ16_15325 [Marinilabilia rubra]
MKKFELNDLFQLKGSQLLDMGKIKFKYFLAFAWVFFASGLFVDAYGSNKDPGSSANVVMKVQELSDRCWNNREKDPELAIDLATEGIQLARAHELKDELAQLYNYSGVINLHYLHKPQSSLVFFNNALNLALQTKDSVQIAYVYNNLGDAFYLTGNVALAGEYSKKSLGIFKRLDHKMGIAYGLINLGQVGRFNENYAASLDYFFRAIQIRSHIEDSLGFASAHLEVAQTYLAMNRKQDAMDYFLKSWKLHRELDNKRYMALSLQGIGDVFFQTGKNEAAMVYYQKALNINMERNYPTGIIQSQVGMARIFGKTGYPQKGEALLETAFQEAGKNKLSRELMEILQAKADFYSDTREYQKALESYQQYVSVYDSIYSEMQYQTMQEIKNRFKLSEDLNRINENLKKEHRVQFFAFVVIFLLLLVVAVFIVLFRIKRKLNARLQESNRAKDQIFSIVSHDLINPFNALFGASDLLELDLKEGNLEEAEKNRRVIHRTVTETFKLLNNILYWARSQQNKLVVSPVEFDLSQLIEEIQSLSENQAYSKKITIETHVSSPLLVRADKNLVRIVLNNFLSNAIKFTPEKGIIQIFTQIEEDYVKVSVKDNGVGIAKEKLPKLFQASEIDSTTGTNQEAGTGLGLMVCKEFIDRQGGEVGARSVKGYGSVFYFTLPTKENE